jgi:hypothetical protein
MTEGVTGTVVVVAGTTTFVVAVAFAVETITRVDVLTLVVGATLVVGLAVVHNFRESYTKGLRVCTSCCNRCGWSDGIFDPRTIMHYGHGE